jgi:manganese efflux pump family protein
VFLKIAAFVLPLGFDTFAVAVLLGLRGIRPLRPAATLTVFEAVMPLVGLLIGRLVGARFETPAVVVGGIVLLGVAIYMFKEALEQEEEAEKLAFTTLRTAAFAGFGISMDELAIGFPMGTSGLPAPETIGAIRSSDVRCDVRRYPRWAPTRGEPRPTRIDVRRDRGGDRVWSPCRLSHRAAVRAGAAGDLAPGSLF